MRRSTGISAVFSLLKAGFAGAVLLALTLSCSDSNGPRVPKDGIPVQVNSVDIFVSDSAKQAAADGFTATLLTNPGAIARSAFVSPAAALSTSSSTCGGGSGPAGYVVSAVRFDPEAIPMYAPYPLTADGYIDQNSVPLGFTFDFYGNTYDKVNVWSNGFLMFGPAPVRSGFFTGDQIPNPANPNNIIAVAWADWEPQLATGSIRFETRGSAPNRRFLIQYNNAPEYRGQGILMSQVVLSEGSNDITIYTNTMSTTNPGARITQGIENSDGTLASVGPNVVNPLNGIVSPRVRAVYRLTNDAIRFSRPRTVDTEAPSITAPANVTAGNDPHLASAVVPTGSPVASDNCTEVVTTSGKRSDGLSLDAPYPVGDTKITWTATDAAGNSATAEQSIKVLDIEAPTIKVPNSFSTNATSPLGAQVSYALDAKDNVGVISLTCNPQVGSKLPIGNNQVTCTASDAAGNSVSGSFRVYVIDAQAQLGNLIEYLISLSLPNGINNPLLNELQQAYGDAGQDKSCKKLGDFLSMLIKKSSGIPNESVGYMSAEAGRIMVVMECSRKKS
jgi:HYR domain-containing protein